MWPLHLEKPGDAHMILPGLHDSDAGHWQSRWEARDKTLLRVFKTIGKRRTAPIGSRGSIKRSRSRAGGHCGAQCGVRALAHWAVGDSSRLIRGALLVAPSDPEAPSFHPGRGALGRFRCSAPILEVLWSPVRNDPVRHAFSRGNIREDRGSEFVMIGEAGHINSGSGPGNWPEGLALLNISSQNSE